MFLVMCDQGEYDDAGTRPVRVLLFKEDAKRFVERAQAAVDEKTKDLPDKYDDWDAWYESKRKLRNGTSFDTKVDLSECCSYRVEEIPAEGFNFEKGSNGEP